MAVEYIYSEMQQMSEKLKSLTCTANWKYYPAFVIMYALAIYFLCSFYTKKNSFLSENIRHKLDHSSTTKKFRNIYSESENKWGEIKSEKAESLNIIYLFKYR